MYTELLRGVRRLYSILLTLHLIGAFTGIYFLTRTVPKSEASLAATERGLVATRELMGTLAARQDPFSRRLERWRVARELLVRETPASCATDLSLLQTRGVAAIDGDPTALNDTLSVLHAVADCHRAAAVATHSELDRRGTAGAWALMFIGTIFTAAIVLMERRSRRGLVVPVAELSEVIQSHLGGNPHRRCHPSSESRLAPVLAGMNQLLDRLLGHATTVEGVLAPTAPAPAAEVTTATLIHFLAKETAPALVLDARGALIATNNAALERLAENDGDELRDRLRSAATGDDVPGVAQREPIGNSGATLFLLVPRPAAESSDRAALAAPHTR